ncbi:MAG: NADPH-dependent FMN reductase [Hirschia sp.]|nr:NADPH-dependent FMN reductase [Hirschia sp.]MBF17767.1 NADPH-dependent FMN reductase [Hirschia sp.]
MNPINIAIVYHSGYGHTARQAEAIRDGVAQVEGVTAQLISTEVVQQHWNDLTAAEAIIFGAPTYMGSASAQFKTFMDATSSEVFAQGSLWKDKIAAGFTNSASRNGDKAETLSQLAIFAAQHGMHWVNLGLPPANNSSKGSEEDLNRLGFFLGAAAQSNADESPEIAPTRADLKTAAHLGRRVAETTLQFVRGRLRQ